MSFSLQFQQHLQDTIKSRFISGSFPQAMVIEGAMGSGRKTAAQFVIALLLCRNQSHTKAYGEPCGECPSCKKLKTGYHPDLETILPSSKSKTKSISVEQVKSIRVEAYIAPHEANCKVYYIPDAENLGVPGQNTLLKIIEEPPKNCFFVFTVTSQSILLPTVASRLWGISTSPLSQQQREQVLTEILPDSTGEEIKILSANCQTVGEAILANGHKDFIARITATESFFVELSQKNIYNMLKILSDFDTSKESYQLFVKNLRKTAVNQVAKQTWTIQPLLIKQFVDIIDKALESVEQNSNRATISVVMVDDFLRLL